MIMRCCFFIVFFSITAVLAAADKDFLAQQRLCRSSPRSVNGESSDKTPLLPDIQKQGESSPPMHRNSAPSRLSLEEKKEQEKKGYTRKLSDVVIRTRSSGSGIVKTSPNSSPKLPTQNLRTSNSSKKYSFINAEQIDCNFLESIRQEVKKIVHDYDLKKPSSEASIKKSNFYAVFRQMRPELIKSNVVAFVFANYFICMVAQYELCKKHLDVRGSQYVLPSTGDFIHCVGLIRSMVDTVTSGAIVWPSIAREDHVTFYYQELLEKNRHINTSVVASPYIGSVIATHLLKNAKNQPDPVKAFFTEVTSDIPKRAKKYCKELVAQWGTLQAFIPIFNVQVYKFTNLEDQE